VPVGPPLHFIITHFIITSTTYHGKYRASCSQQPTKKSAGGFNQHSGVRKIATQWTSSTKTFGPGWQ